MGLKTGKCDNGLKDFQEPQVEGTNSENVTGAQNWPSQTSGGKYNVNQQKGTEQKAPTSGGGK